MKCDISKLHTILYVILSPHRHSTSIQYTQIIRKITVKMPYVRKPHTQKTYTHTHITVTAVEISIRGN